MQEKGNEGLEEIDLPDWRYRNWQGENWNIMGPGRERNSIRRSKSQQDIRKKVNQCKSNHLLLASLSSTSVAYRLVSLIPYHSVLWDGSDSQTTPPSLPHWVLVLYRYLTQKYLNNKLLKYWQFLMLI